MAREHLIGSHAHITDGYNPKIYEWITGVVPASEFTLLDVGCSTGALGAKLKASHPSIKVYGVEASYPAFIAAKERLDDVWLLDLARDLYQFSRILKSTNPDVIILADVLEHLTNGDSLLQCIYEHSQDNTTLCLSLPNLYSFELFQKYSDGAFEYDKIGIFDETHVRFFNVVSAIRMLERFGFKVTFDLSYYLMNSQGLRLFEEHVSDANNGEARIVIGDVEIACRSVARLVEIASYGFMLIAQKGK